jgi:CTP-dependent riboflavin kinase
MRKDGDAVISGYADGYHPRNIIEIATDIRLRDTYGLRYGDSVEVEFP